MLAVLIALTIAAPLLDDENELLGNLKQSPSLVDMRKIVATTTDQKLKETAQRYIDYLDQPLQFTPSNGRFSTPIEPHRVVPYGSVPLGETIRYLNGSTSVEFKKGSKEDLLKGSEVDIADSSKSIWEVRDQNCRLWTCRGGNIGGQQCALEYVIGCNFMEFVVERTASFDTNCMHAEPVGPNASAMYCSNSVKCQIQLSHSVTNAFAVKINAGISRSSLSQLTQATFGMEASYEHSVGVTVSKNFDIRQGHVGWVSLGFCPGTLEHYGVLKNYRLIDRYGNWETSSE